MELTTRNLRSELETAPYEIRMKQHISPTVLIISLNQLSQTKK